MGAETADRRIISLSKVGQEACKLFLEECKREGIDIFLTETYRSQARQKWLYAQGRTRFPGPIVTWTLKSDHMTRLAWDIAVSPPKALYDTATLIQAGKIAKRLGIKWGGDWKKTPDRPHFYVSNDWKAPALNPNRGIAELQSLLNEVGFNVKVDGLKGKETENATMTFQKRVGLEADGIGGPLTIAKLKEVIFENKKPKEEPRMFRPSTATFKKEMQQMLKEAHEQGILNKDEWYKLSVDGKLTLDDAVGLQAAIIRRTHLNKEENTKGGDI